MTYQQVAEAVLRTWGITSWSQALAEQKSEILLILNGTTQEIAANCPEWATFYEGLTLTTSASVNYAAVGTDVLQVIDPVEVMNGSLVSATLEKVDSPVEWNDIMSQFNSSGEPRYYHVRGQWTTAAAQGTPPQMVFAPQPDAAYTVRYNGRKRWVELADAAAVTTSSMPFPQRLHEAVFVPLARLRALSSPWASIENSEAVALQARQAYDILSNSRPSQRSARVYTPEGW